MDLFQMEECLLMVIFLEKFIKMGASYFYISLHSDKSDIHDLIVKSTGAWGQTTKGIENIANHQNKPELIINCIVIKK